MDVPVAVEVAYAASVAYAPATYGGAVASSPSAGVVVDVAVRLREPRWSLGPTGEYGEYGIGRERTLRTLKVALALVRHFRPTELVDPWLSIASGYRYVDLGARGTHGVELVRLEAGANVRTWARATVGPFVSSGVDSFAWSSSGRAAVYFSAFVGLQGTFDLSPALAFD